MGQIAVRLADGVPCFSISEEEEKVNGIPTIHSLSVFQYVPGRAPITIWEFDFGGGDKTLKIDSRVCLLYGAAPAGAASSPAPVLETGKIYGVGMSGRTGRSSDPTLGYHGEFCLVHTNNGGLQAVKVAGSMRQHGETECP